MKPAIPLLFSLIWVLTSTNLLGGTPAAGGSPAEDDKSKVLKLCSSLFEDYEGLSVRGFTIFLKLNDPKFTKLFTSSLLAEFSSAQGKIEELRKINEKKEIPDKLPFPEGGIFTGIYEIAEGWSLETVKRSATVVNASLAISIEKGQKPVETIILSIHEEDGIFKIDDIAYSGKDQSVRDVLKSIFREKGKGGR